MDKPWLRAALFFVRRIVWLILSLLVMMGLISALVGLMPKAFQSGSGPSVEIASRLPITLILIALASVVATLLAVLIVALGSLVLWLCDRAPIPGAILKRSGQVGVSFAVAMPVFVLGLFLLYYFAMRLDWLPVGGWVAAGSESSFSPLHTILPVCTLAILPACLVGRAVLGEIARRWPIAPENRALLLLHLALRFVGYGFIQAIGMLGGALLVESVFSLPGIGRVFLQAVLMRDLSAAKNLVFAFLFSALAFRFLADLLFGVDGFVLLKLEGKEESAKTGESSSAEGGEKEDATSKTGAKPMRVAWVVFCVLLVLVPLVQGVAGLAGGRDSITRQNLADHLLPPGEEGKDGTTYAWGTDTLGRDLRARFRYALGFDLASSLGVALVTSILALPGGLLAAYLAGKRKWWADLLDDLVTFPAEVLTSLPGIVLLVFGLLCLGPGASGMLLLLAAAFILPRGIRIVRGSWQDVDHLAPTWKRVVGVTLGLFILATGLAALTQPALGFIGLGVQSPQPDLGAMMAEGPVSIYKAPHLVLLPGRSMVFALFGWFLLADTVFGSFGVRARESWLELNR